jgi:hypothetical protein
MSASYGLPKRRQLMDVKPWVNKFRGRPSKTEKVAAAADEAKTEIRTNPGVPVAGALGLTMLGAALVQRLRHRKPSVSAGHTVG